MVYRANQWGRAPRGWRWISKMEIRHWRSGKMMRRRDGKPFRLLVRCRR